MLLSLFIHRANDKKYATSLSGFVTLFTDGLSMEEFSAEVNKPWKELKPSITKHFNSKRLMKDILKESGTDYFSNLSRFHDDNSWALHNTTSFDNPKLTSELPFHNISIANTSLLDILYDNARYFKRLTNALGFDGDRLSRFVINLKENPANARFIDILEGFYLHTGYIYHMMDAFNFIFEKDDFKLGDMPGHFLFDPVKFNIAYEEIPEYIKNDYVSIVEILMEVNNLVDFVFGLCDCTKQLSQNSFKLILSPVTRILPKNANDLRNRVSELISIYDELIEDDRIDDSIREYLVIGEVFVNGLRSFVKDGLSISSMTQVLLGFEIFNKYNDPDKNFLELVPFKNIAALGRVINEASKPKGSIKASIKAINAVRSEFLNATESDDEFYNRIRSMAEGFQAAFEGFDSIVSFVDSILEIGNDVLDSFKKIKNLLNLLTPVSTFVSVLDFFGFTDYRKDNLLGAVAEITKLLKKLGFYVPLKETALDFLDRLSGKINDNMKMSDFYDATSNPGAFSTFFSGADRFINKDMKLKDSFYDFEIFGINPIQTLTNIKNSKEKSLLSVINSITDGTHTAPVAKRITSAVELFVKNEDVTTEEIITTIGIDSKEYFDKFDYWTFGASSGVSDLLTYLGMNGHEFLTSMHKFSNKTLDTQKLDVENVAAASSAFHSGLESINKKQKEKQFEFSPAMILLIVVGALLGITIVAGSVFAGFVAYKKCNQNKENDESDAEQV